MTQPVVLVIEADALLAGAIQMHLEGEGFRVLVAGDGASGLAQAIHGHPSLLVLDVVLPKLDGWEVLRQFRTVNSAPVLCLSARDDESDKVQGFELGADDYLTKPFGMQEFLARIRAVMRRARQAAADPGEEAAVLHFPLLSVDYRRRRVSVNGEGVRLTPKEFELLWIMARRTGVVISRDELVKSVWGYASSDDDRTVHTHIKRLRDKLELGHDYQYIHTVWGVGYKFEAVRR